MDLRTPLRTAALTSAALVAALGLAGCGGDDSTDAPNDASRSEFCDAIVNSPDDLDSDDADTAVEAAHDYAETLREIGTPDLSGDQRAGFEVYVDFLADVEASDVDRIAEGDPDDFFDEDDLAKFDAFQEVTAECGPGEVETE